MPDNTTTPGKTNKEPQYYEINDDDDKANNNKADPSMCTSQNETHHDLQVHSYIGLVFKMEIDNLLTVCIL